MSVSDLTKSITEAASSLPAGTKPEERAALLDACNQLKSTLETPFDVVTRLITGVGSLCFVLRLGIAVVNLSTTDSCPFNGYNRYSNGSIRYRKDR